MPFKILPEPQDLGVATQPVGCFTWVKQWEGAVYSLNTSGALTAADPSKSFSCGEKVFASSSSSSCSSSSSSVAHKSTRNYQGVWWLSLETMWLNSWPQHRGPGCVHTHRPTDFAGYTHRPAQHASPCSKHEKCERRETSQRETAGKWHCGTAQLR